MTSTIEDCTHHACKKRHKWRRFIRKDGLSMLIEICEADGETAREVAAYFSKFFGWRSKPVKRP